MKHMDKVHLISVVSTGQKHHPPVLEIGVLVAFLLLYWWHHSLGVFILSITAWNCLNLPILYGTMLFIRRQTEYLGHVFPGTLSCCIIYLCGHLSDCTKRLQERIVAA